MKYYPMWLNLLASGLLIGLTSGANESHLNPMFCDGLMGLAIANTILLFLRIVIAYWEYLYFD